MNHARVTMQGEMELSDQSGATLGGAIRLGELTLVSRSVVTAGMIAVFAA